MTKGTPLSLLAIAFIMAGTAMCGWLAFTATARASDQSSLFTIEEREIGGIFYEVMVRKNAPTVSRSGTAYFF